jgi:hypothetical protein
MNPKLVFCAVFTAAALPAFAAVDFRAEVEPLLRTSCLSCHAGEKAAAGLHLDSKAGALKVILPGDSQHSRLIHRVSGIGNEPRMPLQGNPLTPAQIALIKHWIDEGASWPESAKNEKHWAYVKPVRPPVPQVRNAAWPKNPIDNFVLARLEKEGLSPSPEASREILIRRLSLDLIGLPPSVREVDEFVADRGPNACEKLVERLLASPHYGERWARPWLDLARYADTNGYEKDRRRSIWKYRDWVIQALNKDMPFDQFTIEQIAGDMLPRPTTDQLIATGFHRNTMFNEEGGVDKEEAHWENLVDRVNTTATVWMGTTLGCAQCHNHKYDPFTQKEYYQVMAFFNNTDLGVRDYGDTSQKYIEPQLDLPTPELGARRGKLTAEIAELDKKLKTQTPELAQEQAERERGVLAAASEWTPLDISRVTSTAGTTLTKLEDGSILASGANPSSEVYAIEAKAPIKEITAIRLEALPHESLPRGGPGRDAYGNFFLSEFQAEAGVEVVRFRKVQADDGKIDDKKFSQLWTVDASRDDKRFSRQIVFVAETPFSPGDGTFLRIHIRQKSEFGGQGLGRFRLSVTSAREPAKIVGISAKLRPLLDIPAEQRTEKQKKDLADYYRSVAPSLEPARKRLTKLRKELDNLGIVTTLTMGERRTFERPSAIIRLRGAFTSRGQIVYAATPAMLHPLPENAMPNRLGLARWLVSPENPLTARVGVNRIWETYFGRGIVETSEDFGTQGARPTHPELLDWLAVEFMDKKWSIKAMHRLIATSATYRQASAVTPSLLERDPYNRLLARGPRFRMEAEMIRDAALAASGLLSHKIGGPSVFPPQPEGVWDIPYSEDSWAESAGEDRYRRGLYAFIRRTSPYPTFVTFDAPSREVCTVRRVRTNTPLQALTALNDPAFFEAAKALAKRIVAEGGANTKSRAVYGFRLCVSRHPDGGELDRILSWHEKEREFFERNPGDAAKLAGDADLAAWTMVSNVLLNLDETVSKE